MFDDIEFTAEAMRELECKNIPNVIKARSIDKVIEDAIKYAACHGYHERNFSSNNEINYIDTHKEEYKARGFSLVYMYGSIDNDHILWITIMW